MKRKLLTLLLAGVVLTSTGCGLVQRPDKAAEPAITKEETQSAEDEEEPKTEGDQKIPQESVEIDAARDARHTTPEDPVSMGEWAKTTMYATEDSTYHTVYIRMNKVTTASEDPDYIQSSVDTHNTNSYEFSQLDLSEIDLPSDVELCILDYDLFIPEQFPAPEYGLSAPNLYFSESNIEGGGIPSADGTSTYIGIGSNNEDLATYDKDAVYSPDSVYHLKELFTMVKGYEDYVFEYSSYPEGTTETLADIMYTANFASR